MRWWILCGSLRKIMVRFNLVKPKYGTGNGAFEVSFGNQTSITAGQNV